MNEKKNGFHILATEDSGRFHIIIPEHPNVNTFCKAPEEIISVAINAKEEDERIRTMKNAVCPNCGRRFSGYPALSRKDNATGICPECGTLEALDAAGISDEEKKRILAEMQNAYRTS